jgi:hypothetical protein
MRRALLPPLTALVLLALGTALLASSILLPSPDLASQSVLRDTAVARRFYAAVNETIATGRLTDLQDVVAPHFVEEHQLPGVRTGREGLEEYLVALHDVTPSVRLVAEVLVTGADQVVARVEVRNGAPRTVRPSIFGAPPAVWSAIDILHIGGGVVIGRSSIADGLTLTRPLVEVSLDLPTPTPRVITLTRLSLTPEATWDAPLAGPRLLVLEDGTLPAEAVPGFAASATARVRVDLVERDDRRSDAPQRVMLAAGRSWVVPPQAHLSITNVGVGAARLLVVTFAEPQIPNGAAPVAEVLPSGVEVQTLAGALAVKVGPGPMRLSLERVSLAPDTQLALSSAESPLLIATVTGQLGIEVWGPAWVRNGADGASVASPRPVLSAGDGLLLPSGGVVALHNDGEPPVETLVLMLQPLADPALVPDAVPA